MVAGDDLKAMAHRKVVDRPGPERVLHAELLETRRRDAATAVARGVSITGPDILELAIAETKRFGQPLNVHLGCSNWVCWASPNVATGRDPLIDATLDRAAPYR
jgi:hypothetical protein